MSLLMDALRRAEADKKAQEERAAARAAGDEASPDSGIVTRISPYSTAQDDTVQIDGRALQAAGATMADFDLRIDDNLDRSLSMTAPERLSLEPLEGAADGNDTDFLPTDSGPDDEFDAAEFGGNLTFKGRAERREQTATLPNARGMSSDLDDYFERSQTLAAPSSTARGEDGTLEEVAAHTVAGAQTVFRAGERARSGRVLTWVAALAVCVVLAIAGFGVYYAGLSPAPRRVPSPEVARDVEKPRTELHSLTPLAPPPASSDAGLARIDIQPPSAQEQGSEAPPTPDPVAPQPPSVAPKGGAETPPAMPVAPPQATPRVVADKPREPARPRLPRHAPVAHPANEEIANGEVRISRSQRSPPIDRTLAAGYAAFQAGDLDTAAKLYNEARLLEPERRDTLLGLAAVALKRGDLPRAYDFYAAVLKRNPDDPVASAALFSMTEANGEGGAARLRLLLDGHADAAYLHAALGHWYARRKQWPDAQQAYFDAARLDAANPDYAFNLAVSLDHMGQGAAALEYYQKSLALRGQRAAGFTVQAAQERIAALSAPVAASSP